MCAMCVCVVCMYVCVLCMTVFTCICMLYYVCVLCCVGFVCMCSLHAMICMFELWWAMYVCMLRYVNVQCYVIMYDMPCHVYLIFSVVLFMYDTRVCVMCVCMLTMYVCS